MNVNVVCLKCLKVNRIPKKEQYNKANCGACKASLLDAKPLAADGESLGIVLANSELPVVVDFWAPWCGPCLQMAPIFEQTALKMALQAQFVKVDTQAQQMLGTQYRIESIPTLMMFQNGKEVKRISGALSAVQLERWIREA